jgi:hypothetical protein
MNMENMMRAIPAEVLGRDDCEDEKELFKTMLRTLEHESAYDINADFWTDGECIEVYVDYKVRTECSYDWRDADRFKTREMEFSDEYDYSGELRGHSMMDIIDEVQEGFADHVERAIEDRANEDDEPFC